MVTIGHSQHGFNKTQLVRHALLLRLISICVVNPFRLLLCITAFWSSAACRVPFGSGIQDMTRHISVLEQPVPTMMVTALPQKVVTAVHLIVMTIMPFSTALFVCPLP